MIVVQTHVEPYLGTELLNNKFNFTSTAFPVEVVGRNIDYRFLEEISVCDDENRIYVIDDLNEKINRACTEIIIQFNTDFCCTGLEGNKIRDSDLKYLKYYEILFQGTPVQNDDSLLSERNVTWLVELSTGYKTAVYEVNSEFYVIDLVQCRQIWGTPPSLCLNKSNTITRTRHDGQEVTTPIVPKGYFDFLLERDMRLKEIRQMFEVGGHPGFVNCHEVLEYSECFRYSIFIVMDECNSRVRDGVFDDRINNDADVFTDDGCLKKRCYHLLSSLAYWHDRGIAHGDIRPENIRYIEKNYQNKDVVTNYPQVSHFGLSKQFENNGFGKIDFSDPLEYRHGIPLYTAPELWNRGRHKLTEKMDIYSLGLTFFEDVNGHSPFLRSCDSYLDPHYTDTIYTKYTDYDYKNWALANFDPSLPSSDPSINYGSIFTECTSMSVEAKNLIAKMTFPDPARRLTAREAMQHPWFDEVSSSCEQDNCAATGAVKKVDIVNVGYHPIVWQEDTERVDVGGRSSWEGSSSEVDRLQHALPDTGVSIVFTNSSSSSSSSSSSNNNSGSNSPSAVKYCGWEEGRRTDTDEPTQTCLCELSPPLITSFRISPYTRPYTQTNPLIELASLFRTVEKHEKYLQAAGSTSPPSFSG